MFGSKTVHLFLDNFIPEDGPSSHSETSVKYHSAQHHNPAMLNLTNFLDV